MRVQGEDGAPFEPGGAALDTPNDRVSVLQRKREAARHERGAHALMLTRRNAAQKNQPLGAAADAAKEGAHADLARAGRGERLGADFGAPRRGIPERLRRLFCRGQALPIQPWTLHSAQGYIRT